MKENDNSPELYKTEDLRTYREWFSFLRDCGHVWFSIDGEYYFIFPQGPHRYGLCLGEDEKNGNQPRWEFESEEEFLNAPMFGGRTIVERSCDMMSWDPPFFLEEGKDSGDA